MLKKKLEIEYIFVDEGEKSIEKLNRAYDILFEATLSNLKVSSLSELVKPGVPLTPQDKLLEK